MDDFPFVHVYVLGGGGVGLLFALPLHAIFVATGLVALRACVDLRARRVPAYIGWLPILGRLAPLFGLFGSVTGLVMAFTQIAQST